LTTSNISQVQTTFQNRLNIPLSESKAMLKSKPLGGSPRASMAERGFANASVDHVGAAEPAAARAAVRRGSEGFILLFGENLGEEFD
jgi:hypothetical protein